VISVPSVVKIFAAVGTEQAHTNARASEEAHPAFSR